MDILKKAVNQAVTLLNSCGARYHVIEADGTVHGAAIEPEPKRTRKRDPNAVSYRDVFKAQLAPMQVGDVVVLHPKGEDTTARLQNRASAYCHHVYGKGGCITAVNNCSVQVLRIK